MEQETCPGAENTGTATQDRPTSTSSLSMGVAVGPDVPQLRLKLTGVHNGVEGQCLQRPGEDVLLLLLRHIGQNTLAHAGAVEVVLGADLGVDRQRPAGLHLVHIDDAVPLSHAAVGDLAVFQADLLQIGVDGADDAVLDLDGVGEAQQLRLSTYFWLSRSAAGSPV